MDTQNSTDSSDYDSRPADQQARAAQAHLNPNEPATEAVAGTPDYGTFGKPAGASAPDGRSGSNDNPDEFSEIRDENKAQAHPNSLSEQPGHIVQNQDTPGVRAAEAAGDDNDELRAAWAKDDPRYAGGGTHNEQAGTTPDDTAAQAAAVDK